MKWCDSKTLSYFNYDSKYFIFNKLNGNWKIGSNIDKLIKTMPNQANGEHIENQKIFNIVLHVTNQCNLNCSYCYASDNSEKKELSADNIELLVGLLNESKYSLINFFFHGGEPLFNYSKVKKISEIISKNLNKSYRLHIQSNGTLLKKEQLPFFKEMDFRFSISLDGYKEYHDFHRKNNAGAGSFDIVLKNIELLKEFNIKLATNSVFTSNLDIDLLFNFFVKNNIGSVKLNPVVNSGNAIQGINKQEKDIELITSKYLDFIKKLIAHNTCNDNKIHEAHFSSFIYKFLGLNSPLICHNSSCGMAQNMFMIDEYGYFYPCEELYNIKNFRISRVDKINNFSELIDFGTSFSEKYQLDKESFCKDCRYFIFCGGLCAKRLHIKDFSLCHFRKKTIEYFIKFFVKNSEDLFFLKSVI